METKIDQLKADIDRMQLLYEKQDQEKQKLEEQADLVDDQLWEQEAISQLLKNQKQKLIDELKEQQKDESPKPQAKPIFSQITNKELQDLIAKGKAVLDAAAQESPVEDDSDASVQPQDEPPHEEKKLE